MDILENNIDRRYYYYNLSVNFTKEHIIVEIMRKKAPFYNVIEHFPFDHLGYEDKDFISCCISEMKQNLKDKGW